MTPPTAPRDDGFERSVRQAHDAALAHVSARTLARLRPRSEKTAPARARRPGWALATACAAVFAAVLGARALLAPPEAAPALAAGIEAAAPAPAALPEGDLLVALDEDPDLFLWLASSEARPLAME
ncbi:hypothetical protein [Luteimonas huabeiensis]|uniref:hypothetical protein n=1 Tax=Luteimonas huabeiensis TaxID=1244513 RepID=UPI00046379A8|nr:hypothetical protein [Luteimonas huabeiensis]